ncbi:MULTISPECIES: RNA polymerase sigma factor SigF [unclassified Streptomyces]|uniref:RNA polymerase sigma factor SigF n=1 Tax=unclassified Streptomyces TaxID=2593676 RepID=UPI0011CE87B8|nr:RNA polymerase sigma factor SigF [Streptomyces sp. me109]TXS73139.1 SigB/SigF/SigG family RNA polymerase sigma factor [Streptomyces sp. me109]
MKDGDGPVRDEERGTRGLPAGRADGLDAPRRVAEGADGIPEQARPHPDDGTASRAGDPPGPDEAGNAGDAPVDEDGQEQLPGRDDGQRDPEGAARSTSSEGRRLVTGGTMSEQEQHDKSAAQNAQSGQATQHGPSVQQIQHDPKDPQDRSGARAMFIELRKLPDGSAEYAELRNQLVRMHLPLVEHLARRFRNRGEPLDDLTQVATIGLIKSVDRFDPERGVEFSTYATPTVVGEIKRHFRDKGWAVRVPRRLQELRLALTTATAELSQQHGRSPTVHELAEKLAISEEEVLEGLESANAYSTLSLDVPDTDDESPAVADTLGAEDEALEGVEYRESLKPLLEDLPPREKRILLLRFFGNMTQSQIAQEVGISQMHVSRLLARTLAQLREKLLVEE